MALSKDDEKRILEIVQAAIQRDSAAVAIQTMNAISGTTQLNPFKRYIRNYIEQQGIDVPRSQVIGAYTTADTVTGLGEAVHGRPCTVRAGSTPYEFVQMTYDDVYGKWVSSENWFSSQISATFQVTGAGSDSYTVVAGTNFPGIILPSFTALYSAGLRPQVFVAANIDLDATPATGFVQAAVYQFNSGDTSLAVVGTGGEITHNSTTATYKASGWSDVTFSPTPSESHAYLRAQAKVSSTSRAADFTELSIAVRWVSA